MSGFEDRAYQSSDVDSVCDALARHRRVLYTAPTGSGKTTVAQLVSERLGVKTLFVAHRIEILNQAPAGMIRRSAQSRQPYESGVGLVVVDEAHRSTADSYRRLVRAYPDAKILGLTATPERGDGSGLGADFDVMVVGPSTAELIDLGFLANPRVLTVPPELLPDLKGVRDIAGDYERRELGRRCNVLVGDVVQHWQRHAAGVPTAVFAVNVDHAKALRDAFSAVGVVAEHLDAKTHRLERPAILERLRSGQTSVVTNCQILTEGWDFPGLGCVVVARPTRSRLLYMQIVGRAMRPSDVRPIILDHTGQALVWPPAAYDVPALSAKKRKKRGSGPAPCRRCEGCDLVVHAATLTCPECGLTVERIEVVDGDLEEIPEIPVRRRQPTIRGNRATVGLSAEAEGLIESGMVACLSAKAISAAIRIAGAGDISTATIGRILRDRRGRVRRSERLPRQVSAKRRARDAFLASTCSGGCGRRGELTQVRHRMSFRETGAWTCKLCKNPDVSWGATTLFPAGSRCPGYHCDCSEVSSTPRYVEHGKVWLCPRCSQRKRHNITSAPVRVDSAIECATGCGKRPSKHSLKQIIKARRHRPEYVWTCRDCYLAQHQRSDQSECAGGCGRVPPPDVLQKAAVESRGGSLWECLSCQRSAKAALSALDKPKCSCGAEISGVGKTGLCQACIAAKRRKPLPQATCITCDAVPKRQYMSAGQVRQRKGRPWQCWECSQPGAPRPTPRKPREVDEVLAIRQAADRVAARAQKAASNPAVKACEICRAPAPRHGKRCVECYALPSAFSPQVGEGSVGGRVVRVRIEAAE